MGQRWFTTWYDGVSMSFSTMNGINQSRQQAMAPKPQVQQQAVPYGHPQAPMQAVGMMGTQAHPGYQSAGVGPRPNMQQYQPLAQADAHGVNPGTPVPSAVPQQSPFQFDPNDPKNAALSGYMNGT